jgi:hypothetical protein
MKLSKREIAVVIVTVECSTNPIFGSSPQATQFDKDSMTNILTLRKYENLDNL